MMRFPVTDLLSEEECYRYLLDALHPEGLRCPNGHELPDGQAPHDRSRAPIVKYRCRGVRSGLQPFYRDDLVRNALRL